MEKQTKEQKREEEKRVLAEFEEALRQKREQKEKEDTVSSTDSANAAENVGNKKRTGGFYSAPQPETLHCRRCRTVMENGVCPVCGFKTYVPMSEEKSKKIRTVATGIGLVIFAVLFIVLQATKG